MIVFKAHDAPICSLRFSPDGARLALAGKDSVRLWPATGKGPVVDLEMARASSVDFSPDGRLVGSVGSRTRIWDVD